MTAALAQDARPPLALIRVMNPVLRLLLPTAVGRLIRPFALLEFDARRSGRRLRIPVGYHEARSGRVVVTPAPWRANFRGGIPVTLHHLGRGHDLVAHLEDDPHRVAEELQAIADRRGSLGLVGIKAPRGHRMTEADVAAVDRAVIRFTTP
jgi:hypothetical protein